MRRLVVALVSLAALTAAASADGSAAKRFTSKRYGYSLTLPAGWHVTRPAGRWSGTPYPWSPGVDTYSGPVAGRLLLAAARRVAAGTTLERWTARIVAGTPGICGTPESFTVTTLGGEPARRFTNHCSDGYYLINVAALHRGRGYVLISASSANADAVDQAVFSRALRTWRFVP